MFNRARLPKGRATDEGSRAGHMVALLERIEAKTAVIGVMGMGYVGLPLAATFHRALRSLGWVWVWVWDWVHTPPHTLLSFSPPSFHTISLSLAFTSA